jgi:hypothetical protein
MTTSTITNTVDLIRQDCEIVARDAIFDCNRIENAKKFLKIKISEALQGNTVGKTVIIWSNNLTIILPAVKAIWELGCNVAVHDISVGYTDHPEFKNFYNFIDLIIVDGFKNSFLDKQAVYFLEYDNTLIYDDSKYVPNLPITGDTVAVKTHSSGTTGSPKIIDITHANAIRIVNNNIQILKFDETDRVLHHKTLHHGSLFLNYAIPAFATTTQHYYVELNTNPSIEYRFRSMLNAVIERKITKWLIPYYWIRFLPTLDPVDLSTTTLITIQGPGESEMKEIFRKFTPNKVINNFGCTEVGTMFISVTDINTLNEYNPSKFDYVMPGLEYQIYPDFLKVRYPDLEWQILGDRFILKDKELWWYGRTVYIYADGKQTDFAQLKPFLESYYNTINFSIIPDFEKNLLYLATYDHLIPCDLDQINKIIIEQLGNNFRLSQISYVDLSTVNFGMKPSSPLLLYMFRHKANENI